MNPLRETEKLFVLLSAAAGILLIALAYFSIAALDINAADPSVAAHQSLNYSNLLNNANLLSFVVLLIICNLIYRKTTKAIYFFYAWLFFSAFELLSYIYLAAKHFQFTKDTGIWSGGFQVGFVIGFAWIIIAGLVTAINYIIIKQRKTKIT